MTRERIYIEAVESVMTNASKVMVDVQGGNSLIYLPLDKLMSGRERTRAGGVMNTEESDTMAEDRRGLEDTGRERFDLRGRSR